MEIFYSDKLTPREIEVMELIIIGFGNKDICNKLCISMSTLKSHLANIYTKKRYWITTREPSAMRIQIALGYMKEKGMIESEEQ